jgi:hypothetical protein
MNFSMMINRLKRLPLLALRPSAFSTPLLLAADFSMITWEADVEADVDNLP